MPTGRTACDVSTANASRHSRPTAPRTTDTARYARDAPARRSTDEPTRTAALPPAMARIAPATCHFDPVPLCTVATNTFPRPLTTASARNHDAFRAATPRTTNAAPAGNSTAWVTNAPLIRARVGRPARYAERADVVGRVAVGRFDGRCGDRFEYEVADRRDHPAQGTEHEERPPPVGLAWWGHGLQRRAALSRRGRTHPGDRAISFATRSRARTDAHSRVPAAGDKASNCLRPQVFHGLSRTSPLPSADRARRRRPTVGPGRSGPAGRHGAAPVRRSLPRRRVPPRRR